MGRKQQAVCSQPLCEGLQLHISLHRLGSWHELTSSVLLWQRRVWDGWWLGWLPWGWLPPAKALLNEGLHLPLVKVACRCSTMVASPARLLAALL